MDSKPRGATVFVEGTAVGVTPWTKKLPAGRYALRVELPHHESYAGEIVVARAPVELSLELAPLPRHGTVVVELVDDTPTAARTWIDGTERGAAPGRYQVEPGRHLVEIKHVEVIPHAQWVEVAAGASTTVTATLAAAPGSLLVTSKPAGAAVAIDGVIRGATPLRVDGLTPGAHDVELSATNHETIVQTVEIRAAVEVKLRVDLVAVAADVAPATLGVRSNVEGATITVDDEIVGETPSYQGVIAPGVHTVTVAKTGYQTSEQHIDVSPGETLAVYAGLAKARTPAIVQPSDPERSAPSHSSGRGMIIGGWLTFAVAYAGQILGTQIACSSSAGELDCVNSTANETCGCYHNEIKKSLVPIFGGILVATSPEREDEQQTTTLGWVAASGVAIVQATAVVVAFSGHNRSANAKPLAARTAVVPRPGGFVITFEGTF